MRLVLAVVCCSCASAPDTFSNCESTDSGTLRDGYAYFNFTDGTLRATAPSGKQAAALSCMAGLSYLGADGSTHESLWLSLADRSVPFALAGDGGDGFYVANEVFDGAPRFQLVSIDHDGHTRWQLDLGASSDANAPAWHLAAGSEGAYVAGFPDANQIAAYSPDGAARWSATVRADAAPVVAPDGTGGLYAAANGALTQLDSTGATTWSRAIDGSVSALAARPSGGVVAVGTAGASSFVSVFDATSAQLASPGGVPSDQQPMSVAVAGDRVVVGSTSADGGKPAWSVWGFDPDDSSEQNVTVAATGTSRWISMFLTDDGAAWAAVSTLSDDDAQLGQSVRRIPLRGN